MWKDGETKEEYEHRMETEAETEDAYEVPDSEIRIFRGENILE